MKVLLLLILFVTNCFADPCEDIRLDTADNPISLIPVYNQAKNSQDTDLCYAISASILGDAYRLTKNSKLTSISSPLSIALYAKQNSEYSTEKIGLGYVHQAIAASKDQMICEHAWLMKLKIGSLQNIKDLESTSPLHCRDNRDNRDNNLLEIFQVLEAATGQIQTIQSLSSFLRNLCEGHDHFFAVPEAKVFSIDPNEYLIAMKRLIAVQTQPNPDPAERAHLMALLKEHQDPTAKAKKFEVKLNELLDRRAPQPVAISYCMSSLNTKEHENCVPAHSSVIMGRRLNKETNACEYLVRNSYGVECTKKYAWPCESGSLWVPASHLLKSTTSLTWLE